MLLSTVSFRDPSTTGNWVVPSSNSAWLARDIGSAMRCFNAVTVDYNTTILHLATLSEFYENYYVFNDIAKDTRASPHSPLLPFTWPRNSSMYSGRNNIQTRYQALAESLAVNEPVPIGDLYLALSNITAGLKDTHTSSFANDMRSTFGGLFDNVFFAFVSYTSREQVFPFPSPNTNQLTNPVTGQIIFAINNTKPWDFINFLASNEFSYANNKNVGTNINALFYRFTQKAYTMSNWALDTFQNPLIVEYTDASREFWLPSIIFLTESAFLATTDVDTLSQHSWPRLRCPSTGYPKLHWIPQPHPNPKFHRSTPQHAAGLYRFCSRCS